MTLDEAIKRFEEIAEEAQKIVDTHYFSDTVSIDEIYCDDTEIIEEQLAGYQKGAEEDRQLAEWLRDYKRLLEQQPCEDCVSRKRLMDNYNGVETPVGYRKVVDMEVIKNLPSVIPTTSWISVSERMPNPGEYNGDVDRYYLVQNEYGDMLVARYAKKGYWEQIYQFGEIKEKIVAWQSLPKPYEVERSDKN